MRVLLYTDCMTINTQVDETRRYPALLQLAFPDSDIKNIYFSGMTTLESVENVSQVLDEKPDIVVYGFGVNDALPRGLKRSTRGAIIRWSYSIRMTKGMRLWYRKIFLNPLEYLVQILSTPKHYLTIDESISNIDKCITLFRQNGIKTILINIAPVTNYRFINANDHIRIYNKAINRYCIENDIAYVDAFGIFQKLGLGEALGSDKFHYSEKGHKAVAGRLIEIISSIGDS